MHVVFIRVEKYLIKLVKSMKNVEDIPDTICVEFKGSSHLFNQFSRALDDSGSSVTDNAGHLHGVPENRVKIVIQ